jgi:2-polyprenyl-3-methyl-5-hydroxy-6-metoxy-1,4-benzoquinol methylase
MVALEPEAAGSEDGGTSRFERLREQLGLPSVELRRQALQEFDPGDERFDVLLLHASINHLDEPATLALAHDERARPGCVRATPAAEARGSAALVAQVRFVTEKPRERSTT